MTNGTPDAESNEREFNWEVPHADVYGALAGETRADNVKHGIARSAFLRRLGVDPKAEALWQKWGEWTGVTEAAMEVAKALEMLATAAGVDTWGDFDGLFAENPTDANQVALKRMIDNLDCAQVGDHVYKCRQVDDANRAFEVFFERFDQIDLVRLSEDAAFFVRDQLGLPWPWLCIELTLQFCLGALGWTFGWTFSHDWWVEDSPVIVPDGEWEFKAKPESGETVESAFEQLTEDFLRNAHDLVEHVDTHLPPDGQFPTEKGMERIERNVGWLYQSWLCEVSIRQISREYHSEVHPDIPFSQCDDRKTIRDGIQEAERLLGLTSFEFK